MYVGKTSNFNKRKCEHLGLYSNNTKEWIPAIGTNNVEITPVECFETKEEALKREDELIREYNTIENGYNKNRSGLIWSGREKEYWQEYHKEWNQDNREKYNEYHKKYMRDRYQAKKLGMTVAEYRQREVG